ncbi:MAG: hypothetical protein WC278_00125 [Bacilli bacterium]|jgi:hypothetical protein|nr:hypothetical protein [Bacilli bacterium]MDD3120902.1 hypothetical protein [Bacilli bacterium]MDD4063097.1 hypothetical protein [Bacilli bacterium]MDD4481623.1 hypothetical protein [Bacilli bacterium]MDY0363201.1 hypothetical protein [Bacilli bacterium]
MSIIQAIKKTEVKVELAKIEANDKVKKLLIQTKEDANLLVEEMHSDFLLEKEKQEITLENEVKAMEKEFNKQYEDLKIKIEQVAHNNEIKAVNYILKKVFEI